MSTFLVIGIIVVILVAIGLLFLLLGDGAFRGGGATQAAVSLNLRSLVASQRQQTEEQGSGKSRAAKRNLAMAAAAESQLSRKRSSRSNNQSL